MSSDLGKKIHSSFILAGATGLQTWGATNSPVAGLLIGAAMGALTWKFNDEVSEPEVYLGPFKVFSKEPG